jgi:hypothetical protein
VWGHTHPEEGRWPERRSSPSLTRRCWMR